MVYNYPRPVVMGTDLSGLLISVALSQARIEHHLIGFPPTEDSFHSGETTSMVAPLILLRHFPELQRYTREKKRGIVYTDQYQIQLDFAHPSLAPFWAAIKLVMRSAFRFPMQIDRVALDQAFFEKASCSPYCRHLEEEVEGVDYDPVTDTVRQATLTDGTRLALSHLFDASGQQAALSHLIGLPLHPVDEPVMVLQAYFRQESVQSGLGQSRGKWQDELNIVRLFRERSGVDGMAVLIPLGHKLSLRVSVPLNQMPQTAAGQETEEILWVEGVLAEAEARLGDLDIPAPSGFGERTHLHRAVNQLYVGERAYGANWLLTGMAYCNSLVTAAINADPPMEALFLGPEFLKSPAQTGAHYQQFMDSYLKMHEVWHLLATHPAGGLDGIQTRATIDAYGWANQAQLAQAWLLQPHSGPMRSSLAMVSKLMASPFWTRLPTLYSSMHKRSATAHNP